MRNRKNLLIKMTASFKIIIVCCLLLLSGSLSIAFSQSKDDFPIPETYKTEGIPAIKNSEVENLFYDPASIRSNLIWDAGSRKKRLLVTDETNHVYLLNSPLSKPEKLMEKVIPYTVKASPNGAFFAYSSDQEDEDNFSLYLYDLKEKSSKKLISLVGKDESVDSFIWSKTGDSLFFMRVDYDAKVSHLCQFNLISEKCFDVKLNGNWSVLDSTEDKILLKHWKAASSQFLYLYDLQTNKLVSVDEQGNSRKGFFAQKRVFWTSEGNAVCKKDPCILTLNLNTNKISQLSLPDDILSLSDAKISTEGSNLLIQETKNGIDFLHVFEIKKDKIVKRIPPFISGSKVVWSTRWLSNKEVLYTLEDISQPASIQSYNISTKQITEWTKGRLPKSLENKVKKSKIFKWMSFDQKEIPGFIVSPQKNQTKSPVLIFVHGGPQILDKPIFNSQDIQFASNLGLTIIHTNIRGSSGFGKAFMDADNKERRGDAVKDIQALLDWIKTQPDLDSDRIYLRGESYGGFVVLAAALLEPKRIKGVIAEYPLVSISGYLSQSWINEPVRNEYGDSQDKDLMQKLDMLSPLNNVSRWNNIPLFLTRGKLDERVPEKDVIDLKTQLQNTGTEVWYIFSNDSGHGFNGEYVKAAMYLFLKNQLNKGGN